MSINAKIGMGIVGLLVAALIYYFIFWWEPALKSGVITNIQHTSALTTYDQHEHSVYRNVSRRVRDSDGDYRTVTDRVFDHHEYSIDQHYNGPDIIITIQAESSKHADKMLSAKIYVTADRVSDFSIGDEFYFDKEFGDKRHDSNNTTKEVARRDFVSFNLDEWIASHTTSGNW